MIDMSHNCTEGTVFVKTVTVVCLCYEVDASEQFKEGITFGGCWVRLQLMKGECSEI